MKKHTAHVITVTVTLGVLAIGAGAFVYSGLYNIGAEGQLYAGALAAVAVGGLHGGTGLEWSPWVLFPLMMLAAALAGAGYVKDLSGREIGLKEAPDLGWFSPVTLALFAGFAVLMALTIMRPRPAVVRAFDEFDTSRWFTWVFLGFLALELGLVCWLYFDLERRRARGASAPARA